MSRHNGHSIPDHHGVSTDFSVFVFGGPIVESANQHQIDEITFNRKQTELRDRLASIMRQLEVLGIGVSSLLTTQMTVLHVIERTPVSRIAGAIGSLLHEVNQ